MFMRLKKHLSKVKILSTLCIEHKLIQILIITEKDIKKPKTFLIKLCISEKKKKS